MGIRLVTEILDRYHGPDGRKLWLLAWAEKANDRTRAGWPTREVLAHRTGRSPSRVSHISDELVAEGVLKRDGGGNRGGPARFILLPLSTPEKGALWAHPFEEGEDAGAPASGQTSKGAESPRKGAESEGKGAHPSPPPAKTGSLPLIEPSEEQPSFTASADAPTAQTILASFIDWVRDNGGELTERTKGQLAPQIRNLLDQDVPDRYIRSGLADWYVSGHNPQTFDSFANTARNAAAIARAKQNRAKNGSAAAPGPDRARGWMAAGAAYQADVDNAGRELTR